MAYWYWAPVLDCHTSQIMVKFESDVGNGRIRVSLKSRKQAGHLAYAKVEMIEVIGTWRLIGWQTII
ncbi:hypothetical protein FRX31_010801 [Thalictrum thalictroides]|uniref:Uncharacterized protein n=1 Tax=Thalictrum thalictroides TaxID=46969 RepID=A0A7J6WRP4_THATH|nr:hypothetical protein FRX31_010801 [Thalictrum thalictroides]